MKTEQETVETPKTCNECYLCDFTVDRGINILCSFYNAQESRPLKEVNSKPDWCRVNRIIIVEDANPVLATTDEGEK
jgi:hypothetical protein